MIHYDKATAYATQLEEAIDLLDARLRADVDKADTTIVAVPSHATFYELTGDPMARKLDQREQFGIVHGAYSRKASMLVLRTTSRAIVRPSLPVVLAHEATHVRDFLAGDGTKPFSALNAFIAERYTEAKSTGYAISQYALVSPFEMLAEATRSVLGCSHTIDDDQKRLLTLDPDLYSFIDNWLGQPVSQT